MKCLLNSFRCYKFPLVSVSHLRQKRSPNVSVSAQQNTRLLSPYLHGGSNYVRFKSSTTAAWLSRQRGDHFLKARAEANFRSRSAFKLLQINEQYRLFPPLSSRARTIEKRPFIVVDLGCAPGGWTQASLKLLGFSRNTHFEEEDSEDEQLDAPQVVGVDLLQTEPVLGARFLHGNFLDENVQKELRHVIKGHEQDTSRVEHGIDDGVADIILSDMAPNLTGNRITDIEAGLELCRSVLAFARKNLRRNEGKGKGFGGSLVIKHFAAPELTQFREQELAPFFSQKIKYTKPEASRSNSSEAYFVCQGFKGGNH